MIRQRILIFILFLLPLVHVTAQPDQVKNGHSVFRYENGNISSEGEMRDGRPDGFWKTFYEDGTLKTEGFRQNFELDSTWKFYRVDGSLERVLNYRAGIKSGIEEEWSETGNKLASYQNVDGKFEGEAQFYYESGELYRTLLYSDGKENGKGFEYAKDGRVITFLNYSDGFIRSIEKVNRFNKDNQKTGLWVEYYSSGITKEEGTWSNGVKNGIFKFYNKKGDLDRIEKYRGGELLTDAMETVMLDIRREYYEDGTLKMIGSYQEGSKQGIFREYGKEGSIINSYVYDGNVKVGEGIVDASGSYQGQWKLYFPSGELKAEGSFKEGKKEGPWMYYFVNGSIEQRGEYRDGLPTGKWTWYYDSSELLREEYYRKGKEDGSSVEYSKEGTVINQGEYIDGYKTGPWVLSVGDHTEKGDYIDGERTGEWIYLYDNGKTAFEGEYLNGIPLGKHKYYYRNGTLKEEGKYKGGVKDGEWATYDSEGLLLLVIRYKNGEKIKLNGSKIPMGDSDPIN